MMTSRLDRLERFLAQGRPELLAVILLALAVFKAGFAFEVAAQSPTPAFPMPEPGLSPTSYGMPILVTALNLTGNAAAIGLVMLALTAATLALFALLLLRHRDDTEFVVAVIVLLGPIGVVALGNVGRHDWFVITGSLLLAWKGKSISWALLAVVLMVLGNPEQAFLASAALFLLTLVPSFRFMRKSAILAVTVSGIAVIALSLWVEVLGLDSRASWIDYHLGWGLKNFFLNLPLSIYAAYGAGWVLIAVLVWRCRGWTRVYAIAATIAIPFAATILTADQTRVFVGVSTVVAVLAFRYSALPFIDWMKSVFPGRWRLALLVALIALPAIEITYAGGVRTPFQWVFDFVVGQTSLVTAG